LLKLSLQHVRFDLNKTCLRGKEFGQMCVFFNISATRKDEGIVKILCNCLKKYYEGQLKFQILPPAVRHSPLDGSNINSFFA
jgi:hypothetical protein